MPHHRAKASRWAHANTPDALRRRRAAADARREALAASAAPVDPPPATGSVWQTILVLDSSGEVMHRIVLRVPGGGYRCDQHAAEVDGKRMLMTATQVGAVVASSIQKRPSQALQAEVRRGA